MDIQAIKRAIGSGDLKTAENLWMQGVEDNPAPQAVQEILEALVDAEQADMAETLGWALLEAHGGADEKTRLALASAALLGAPDSEELRNQTIELIKAVHGEAENFQVVYDNAGLEKGQSPKRALRTFGTCLNLKPGELLVNRYDGDVIEIVRLSPLEEWEFKTERGDTEELDMKKLADEYDLLEEKDFRRQVRALGDQRDDWIKKKPGEALLGLAIAGGGKMDADQIKAVMVPKYLDAKSWSGWWGRARTAAKKMSQLTLQGRPIEVEYHPDGMALEDELAESLVRCYHTEDYLQLLRTYLSEAAARKQEPQAEFLAGVTNGLAGLVTKFMNSNPANALQARLGLDVAKDMGVESDAASLPTSAQLLEKLSEPAETLAALSDDDLWNPALTMIDAHPEASKLFCGLLESAPADKIDAIAERMVKLGDADAIRQAVIDAYRDPVQYVSLACWAWNHQGDLVGDEITPTTMLCKLLDGLYQTDHHWEGTAEAKRQTRQQMLRSISAQDFQGAREVIAQCDASMAAVIKNKVDRTDGLAITGSEKMNEILQEHHYSLFVKKKIAPWKDETVIWSSQAGLDRQQEELRILEEETMPANAKQIGEAAEQGDLRENADWQAAIEERDMLVSRHRKMNEELTKARVLTMSDVPAEHVGVGAKVTLKRVSDGQTVELSFMGPWDSDPDGRVYSYKTKLAESLMGKPLGGQIALALDGEGEAEYLIDAIAPAVGVIE